MAKKKVSSDAMLADCSPMCKTCAFALIDKGDDFGFCRRNPPAFVPDEDGSFWSFASILSDEWCGEFKRRTN